MSEKILVKDEELSHDLVKILGINRNILPNRKFRVESADSFMERGASAIWCFEDKELEIRLTVSRNLESDNSFNKIVRFYSFQKENGRYDKYYAYDSISHWNSDDTIRQSLSELFRNSGI